MTSSESIHYNKIKFQHIKKNKNKYFIGLILTMILFIMVGIIAYVEPAHRTMSVDNQIEYGDIHYAAAHHKSKIRLMDTHHSNTLPKSSLHLIKHNHFDTMIQINNKKYRCTAHSGRKLLKQYGLRNSYLHNKVFPLSGINGDKHYLVRI